MACIRVEVELHQAFEIHNVPIPDEFEWWDANILAIGFVFQDLKRRVINEGLALGDLRMHARSVEFSATTNY